MLLGSINVRDGLQTRNRVGMEGFTETQKVPRGKEFESGHYIFVLSFLLRHKRFL